eukprot:9497916-Pyramimonas_sp.AAC.1
MPSWEDIKTLHPRMLRQARQYYRIRQPMYNLVRKVAKVAWDIEEAVVVAKAAQEAVVVAVAAAMLNSVGPAQGEKRTRHTWSGEQSKNLVAQYELDPSRLAEKVLA